MDHDVLKNLSILHVEDEKIIQMLFKSILGSHVREFTTADNGRQGLEMYHEKRPDIIITDIRMPLMDGLEMVERIRAEDQEIPVIVTTAYNDTEFLLRAIDLGVDRYVVKPVDKPLLLSAVTRVGQVIHHRREVEEADRFSRFIIDLQPNFVVTINEGRREYINQTFLAYLGVPSLEVFEDSGLCIGDFVISIDGEEFDMVATRWMRAILDSGKDSVIVRLRSGNDARDGAFLATWNKFPGSEKYVITFTDVTGLEDERTTLAYQAATDYLTGAVNRMKFMEVLGDEIDRTERYSAPLSVIMFDIDNFKCINDECGHDVGDVVLIDIARLVAENTRSHDLVARWGGEEFMLLAPGTSADKAAALAEKLRHIISRNRFGDLEQVTCSFGVTQYVSGEQVEVLLKRVDEAMYEAKRQGRDRVAVR